MMVHFTQRNLRLSAALALLLVGVWATIVLAHEHAGVQPCHVCNALQFTSADLVAPIVVAAPAAKAVRFVPLTLRSEATSYPRTPPGRAPPLA